MANIKYSQLAAAATKASDSSKKLSAEEISDFFLSVGTQLKGQNQSCYQAIGVRFSAEGSVDPLKLHTAGVFSSQLTVTGAGEISDKVLILVQVGPETIGGFSVETPLMLNFCSGTKFAASLECSVFAGIDFNVGYKDLGTTASLNLGAHGNARLSGENFYAVNVQPLAFLNNDVVSLKSALSDLISVTDFKEFLKAPAVNFINKYSGKEPILLQKSGALAMFKSFLVSRAPLIETKTLINELKEIEDNDISRQPIRVQARVLSKNLNDYKEKKRPAIATSVNIFSGDVKAHGKLTASVNIQANLLGFLGLDVASENEFLKANVSTKPVYIRYQTAYPAKSSRHFDIIPEEPSEHYVALTQDTSMVYTSYDFELASTNTSISGSARGKELAKKTLEKSSGKASENRMSYVTTTVYWSAKVPGITGEGRTTSLPGSGVSFGCSFPLDALKSAIEWDFTYTNVEQQEYESFATEMYIEDEAYREDEAYSEIIKRIVVSNYSLEGSPVNEAEIFKASIHKALNIYNDWLMAANKKGVFKHSPPTAYTILRRMISDKETNHLKEAVVWLLDKDKDAPPQPEFDRIFGSKLLKKDLTHRVLASTVGPTLNKSTFTRILENEGYDRAFNATMEARQELEKIQKQVHTREDEISETVSKVRSVEKTRRIEKSRQVAVKETRAVSVETSINANTPELRSYFVQGCDDKIEINKFLSPKRAYLQFVADQLNVSLDQIFTFFSSPHVRDLILNYKEYSEINKLDAIILESGFLTDPTSFIINNKMVSGTGGINQQLIELESSAAQTLLAEFNQQQSKQTKLNVIRMRFRIQDTKSKDSTLFKLGAKLLGNGANIKVSKIEEAGSEGIIDLRTEWYGSSLPNNSDENYKTGVPAVALFCQ